MGGFYGSVQVRTTDRPAVKAAAELVATAHKIHCLIGPEINGWVGIYPEGHGQDDTVGGDLAKHLEADVLHLMVHDDDVLAYRLWRKHELVDSYWSKPGYFGEENRIEEETRRGDPEKFQPIVGEKAKQLTPLLDRDQQPVFAYEQLAKIAKLLGITNAVTAYENLKEGERDPIKVWRQFEEIPLTLVRAEGAKKQTEIAKIKAQRKAFQKDGLLFLFEERSRGMPQVCPAGEGFVVVWTFADFEINLCAPPFDRVEPAAIESPTHVTAVVSDATASRVAFSAGKLVRVWDVTPHGWKHVRDISESDLAVAADISADGKIVTHASRQEVVVTEVETGKRIHSVGDTMHHRVSLHRDQKWLATAGSSFRLVSLYTEPRQREIFIGGKSNPYAAIAPLLQKKFASIDLDQIEKSQDALVEDSIASIGKVVGGKTKGLAVSGPELEAIRQKMNEGMKAFVDRSRMIREGNAGQLPGFGERGTEHVSYVRFSRDGRWIWFGTDKGLRVFDWAQFPREAGSVASNPVWSYHPVRSDPGQSPRGINYITEEPDGTAVVFGGESGVVMRLDLLSGAVFELIKLPGGGGINGLVLSHGGDALSVCSYYLRKMNRESNRKDSKTWEVWNYRRLLAGATQVQGPRAGH